MIYYPICKYVILCINLIVLIAFLGKYFKYSLAKDVYIDQILPLTQIIHGFFHKILFVKSFIQLLNGIKME